MSARKRRRGYYGITLYATWSQYDVPTYLAEDNKIMVGHYPQKYVGDELNAELETALTSASNLVATGNVYTVDVDTRNNNSYSLLGNPRTIHYVALEEYFYLKDGVGVKYARLPYEYVKAVNQNQHYYKFTTSNDELVVRDEHPDAYWFEVQPIPCTVMRTTADVNNTLLTVVSDVVLGSHSFNYANGKADSEDFYSRLEWASNPEIRKFLNGSDSVLYRLNDEEEGSERALAGLYSEALEGASPKIVQATIKNQKIADPTLEYSVDGDGNIDENYSTTDYVWIPSVYEFGQLVDKKARVTDLGRATYSKMFSDTDSRSYYWLRSACFNETKNQETPYYVALTDLYNDLAPTWSLFSVRICFAIDMKEPS